MAFLVGDKKAAVVVQADAVGGAKSIGENVGALAVGAHAQERAVVRHERGQRVAGGLGVIKISRRINLQAHREFVEVLGDLVVAVEAFEEVDLAVAVEVAQAHELIAAGDEKFVAAEFHAERLKESAGDAFPTQRGGRGGQETVHAPHVAVPGGDDGGLAVGREIEAAGTHPALPRVFNGQRKGVGDECAVRIAGHGGGGDFLGPARRAAVSERVEVEGRGLA